jgi:hypothetical protein
MFTTVVMAERLLFYPGASADRMNCIVCSGCNCVVVRQRKRNGRESQLIVLIASIVMIEAWRA